MTRTLSIGLCLALAMPLASYGQDYPGRSIRIVVPAAASGSGDILARFIAAKLHERYAQPVIVENRAGAGQMIGADAVAKAPADGYSLLFATVTYTTSAATQPKLAFNPISDLTGITMIGEGPFMMVVHPSLPVRSVRDLIALAKARPGQINYSSSGTGGVLHLVTEVFAANAGIRMTHVPYKSVAPAVTDTVGGHVSLLLASVPSVLPQVRAGRLRALAVTSIKRSRFVPEVPTLAESGLPGFEARQWWGMFATGKTPSTIVSKLNGDIQHILSADEVKNRLASEGAEPVLGMSPETFDAVVRADIARWRKVVQNLGIQVQ
jgi:tripartite-type tricarboxylate transporter receptor subunit TctC